MHPITTDIAREIVADRLRSAEDLRRVRAARASRPSRLGRLLRG